MCTSRGTPALTIVRELLYQKYKHLLNVEEDPPSERHFYSFLVLDPSLREPSTTRLLLHDLQKQVGMANGSQFNCSQSWFSLTRTNSPYDSIIVQPGKVKVVSRAAKQVPSAKVSLNRILDTNLGSHRTVVQLGSHRTVVSPKKLSIEISTGGLKMFRKNKSVQDVVAMLHSTRLKPNTT